MIEDEEIEEAEVTSDYSNKNRKKIMILLLPLLIVIGASVGIYFALNKKYDTNISGYNIVQYNKNNKDDVVVFYDMPELKTVIMGKDDKKQEEDNDHTYTIVLVISIVVVCIILAVIIYFVIRLIKRKQSLDDEIMRASRLVNSCAEEPKLK